MAGADLSSACVRALRRGFRDDDAKDYWEIGASGARYDREFILEHLAQNPPVDADAEGWICGNFELRELGNKTYLLTYTLNQRGRHTRRATIWRRNGERWQILYHQGTVLAAGATA